MIHIDGTVRVCGLFGDPVAHSFSPAMHNAGFRELGLNWAYIPFRVTADNLAAAVDGVRALGMAGVNITVPHKQAVLGCLDHITEEAALIGAVNTVVNRQGLLWGYNTDGPGFIRALAEDAGFSVSGRRALILGAGGAARAVAVSLALAGASGIIIANRSPGKARELAELVRSKTGCPAGVLGTYPQPGSGSAPEKEWQEAVGGSALVVQTTTLGMHPNQDTLPPFPYHLLGPGHLAVDLVYNPRQTLFLKRCAGRGAGVSSGLGMLLYQGVQAFEMWTGVRAPVERMRKILKGCVS
ncbi:shikimate 5-dehydrogenase I alpha [Desulfocucumis palustris]|uniref:Shikimate dehydrogenase (NADP(+)) n=1 Tax=Desulfocucumis palustris TaxID=1898651 RepID=A0A2L2XCY6_9FIRM|nr:shikimate dehydrogenase [Desulfocucumis palustris]GBF34207.1 shikimate 5-dehydrogenase I alpha [Desulfocucumis palustris]